MRGSSDRSGRKRRKAEEEEGTRVSKQAVLVKQISTALRLLLAEPRGLFTDTQTHRDVFQENITTTLLLLGEDELKFLQIDKQKRCAAPLRFVLSAAQGVTRGHVPGITMIHT